MKKLVLLASLTLLSSVAQADPLQWNSVPVSSFGSPYNPYAAPAPQQQNPYGSSTTVRGVDGTSSVQQLNNNTYMVRDASGNLHYCTVLSNNQVRCT